MKVKELITLLREQDQEDEIAVFDADNGNEYSITDVYSEDGFTNVDIVKED